MEELRYAYVLSVQSDRPVVTVIVSACLCVNIPYSGKMWRALNLANWSLESFSEF